jgi:hypothetical protein
MFKRILLTLVCATALSVAGFSNMSKAQGWGDVHYATPNTVYYAPNYGYPYSPYTYSYSYPTDAPSYYYYYGSRYYTAAPIYSARGPYVRTYWR